MQNKNLFEQNGSLEVKSMPVEECNNAYRLKGTSTVKWIDSFIVAF